MAKYLERPTLLIREISSLMNQGSRASDASAAKTVLRGEPIRPARKKAAAGGARRLKKAKKK